MTVDGKTFLIAFRAYMFQWQALDKEYSRIPNWRWFKQQRNISKRIKLTKAYTAQMVEWGII